MAYVKNINKNTSDSHQTSPGYVLTFVRWDNRDTLNYKNLDSFKTRDPMLVINDAIQVNVTHAKNNYISTATIVLKGGDINYSTAVHPGDFVFVNLLNWESEVVRVYNKAANKVSKPNNTVTEPDTYADPQAINGVNDGFKGVFKIQNIVKQLTVDPSSGMKNVMYTITASGFTEFNNIMYYNNALVTAFKSRGSGLWATAVGEYFQDLLKVQISVQTILPILFKILIGKSNKDPDAKVPNYGNKHFKVPVNVGRLLGVPNAKFVNEIYNFVIGIWGNPTINSSSNNIDPLNFNPGFVQDGGSANFFTTGKSLEGNKLITIENWNQNTVWSIIKGTSNDLLNEMYTAYRVNLLGRVMPTVIVRQKPFTHDHFKSNGLSVTKFLSLPRWKISADLLLSITTSKNEGSRYNFVQVFGRGVAATDSVNMADQITQGNFIEDVDDIQRHGLKPFVATSNFDFFDAAGDKRTKAPAWAKLVGDWIIDGHLKESGTMSFIGITDPICPGDNIEFDDIVYHIESVNHIMTINPSNGMKSFRTNLTVSYGIHKDSSLAGPIYANMEHTDIQNNNDFDWVNEKILPGISDTQDIPSRNRTNGEETGSSKTKEKSFTPSPPRKQYTNKKKK